jgi:F5/8 type C domain/PEP-CTERM motif
MKNHIGFALAISLGIIAMGRSQSGGNGGLLQTPTIENPVNVAERGNVTASSVFDNEPTWGASKVIDGSWDGDRTNYWLAKGIYDTRAGTLPAWLKFDLGQEYTISSVSLFNTKNYMYNDRGAKDFNFLTSSDGVNYLTPFLSGTLDWQATSFQTFDFSSFVTTRYLQIQFTSAYGQFGGVGLNEVKIMAVPEPSSLSLLALGGVVALRRRKRA